MKYEFYPDKACLTEAVFQCKGCLDARIKSIRRYISIGYGFRKNKERK